MNYKLDYLTSKSWTVFDGSAFKFSFSYDSDLIITFTKLLKNVNISRTEVKQAIQSK